MYRLGKLGSVIPKPIKSYTTNFLWCGTQCLNPHEMTCRTFNHGGGDSVKIENHIYPNTISRIDHIEKVVVRVFSNGSFSENDDLFTPC
jgi:hypothetical protein